MPTSPEYYQRNRERILAYGKTRYLQNKEKLLEYQKEYRAANKDKVRQRVRDKRKSRNEQAIEMLGGKCQRCEQVYDPVCYDFHHTDPAAKEFTIGENVLVGKDKFFNEVKKCILLCANCHRLTHKELQNT